MKIRATGFGTLVLFLALVLGGGLIIGFVTAPGAWYATLSKPPFNPPSWIFAPVWTALHHDRDRRVAGLARGPQQRADEAMVGAAGSEFRWSPIFFSGHRIDIALGVIVLLLIMVIGFIMVTWRQDKIASLLFTPYAAWVAFASVLNGAIWLLN